MTGVNWGLLPNQNIGQNAMAAFKQGKEMRREADGRNALAKIMGAGQTPGIGDGQAPQDMTADWEAVGQWKPELAYKLKGQMREQEQAAAKAQRETVENLARLTSGVTDDRIYQERLATARTLGIDVSQAPPTFDPNWVQTQNTIANVWLKDGGQQISGLARELQDAGYKPGTNEFQQAMITALSGKYGSESYDPQTGLVTRSALPLPSSQAGGTSPAASSAPPPRLTDEPYTFEAYQGYVRSQGKEAADAFLKRNNAPVSVSTVEQVNQLPSGTVFITPDGRRKVKP